MGCEPELLKKEAMPTAAAMAKLDLPEGVPPLTSLYMYIAGSCNLACRHCWISPTYEPDNSKGQFLKLEYVKKAVREAKPLGLQSVKLTGGEPTLHPNFGELLQWLDQEKLRIIIESNGTLIDKPMAALLMNLSRKPFISVSLDGANPQTHDNLRGIVGSHELAISGIKNLVSAGFHPQMICTLHRGNLAETEAIITLAENLGCGSIKFNHVQAMGRGDNFSDQDMLSSQELLSLFTHVEHELQSGHKITIHFDIPIAFHPIRKLVHDSLCQCGVTNLLGVLATGQLSLCGVGVTIPELIYGDITRDDLSRVWCEAPGLTELRTDIPGQLNGICSRCIHRDICLGQCVACNYQTEQNLRAPYYYCKEMEELGLFPASRKIDRSKEQGVRQ